MRTRIFLGFPRAFFCCDSWDCCLHCNRRRSRQSVRGMRANRLFRAVCTQWHRCKCRFADICQRFNDSRPAAVVACLSSRRNAAVNRSEHGQTGAITCVPRFHPWRGWSYLQTICRNHSLHGTRLARDEYGSIWHGKMKSWVMTCDVIDSACSNTCSELNLLTASFECGVKAVWFCSFEVRKSNSETNWNSPSTCTSSLFLLSGIPPPCRHRRLPVPKR